MTENEDTIEFPVKFDRALYFMASVNVMGFMTAILGGLLGGLIPHSLDPSIYLPVVIGALAIGLAGIVSLMIPRGHNKLIDVDPTNWRPGALAYSQPTAKERALALVFPTSFAVDIILGASGAVAAYAHGGHLRFSVFTVLGAAEIITLMFGPMIVAMNLQNQRVAVQRGLVEATSGKCANPLCTSKVYYAPWWGFFLHEDTDQRACATGATLPTTAAPVRLAYQP